MDKKQVRAVVTVVGKDRVGIICELSKILADCNVNIEDISQTILKEIFNMIMLVDLAEMKSDFADLQARLEALGNSMGLIIRIRHNDIFESMHRI